MSDVTLPHTLTPGTNENAADAQANDEALRDGFNAKFPVADTTLASPNNAVYRLVQEVLADSGADIVAGKYFFSKAQFLIASATAGQTARYSNLVAADYSVAGLTTKLCVRASVAANTTQPTITFTVGLYPITVAGAADQNTFTLGTVVPGSTVAIASPAASTITVGTGTDFTFPADGAYALGVVTSGTLTNNNASALTARLQVRNV